MARVATLAAVLLLAATVGAEGPRGDGRAAERGLSRPTAEAVRDTVRGEMSRLGIPGISLAVAHGGGLVHVAAFGWADVENSVRARPETTYRLASVSKPITAAAVLRLAEAGKLDLDAPVARYCPFFPEKSWPVTARQLLCHQGGVRTYRPGEQPMTRRFTSLVEGLALFAEDPLDFEPGTRVLYSTYGYTILGCAAAVASGRSFAALLEEEVFIPAGMSATRTEDVREVVPHRAEGYVRDGEGRLRNSALADMSYKAPGGGLIGTAPDVARFGAALLDGRVVSARTLERMLEEQRTRDGRSTGQGLGLAVGTRSGRREAWHTGGQERVSTVIHLAPDARLVVALLSNLEGVQPELHGLARRVADLVAVAGED